MIQTAKKTVVDVFIQGNKNERFAELFLLNSIQQLGILSLR